jgi:hypothetical protein
MSGPGVIAVEEPRKCELCGAFEECRPYGPNGEQICFNCGTKDEAAIHAAARGADRNLFGVTDDAPICPKCNHAHAHAVLGRICIGCPCEERP